MSDKKSKRVISPLGQDGTLYGAVDIPDGEYSTAQINARVAAQEQAFENQYQTTSQGPGDGQGPTNAGPYPKAVYPTGKS